MASSIDRAAGSKTEGRRQHELLVIPASRNNPIGRDVLAWQEGDWRCEVYTGSVPGEGRLLVYCGDTVVSAESVPAGMPAYIRAEVLRQRVLRGNLRAPE